MKKKRVSKGEKSEEPVANRRRRPAVTGKTNNKNARPGKNKSIKKTKVKDAKSIGSSAQGHEVDVLPRSYGLTRLELLPIDPFLVHVHYDIAPSDFENLRLVDGWDPSFFQPVLRFYDVTDIIFGGANANSFCDISIEIQEQNWYVNLWKPGKACVAELGFKNREGIFYPLVRSNFTQIPPALTAEEHEVRYMRVEGTYRVVEMSPNHNEEAFAYDLTDIGEKAFMSDASSAVFQPVMEGEHPFAR